MTNNEFNKKIRLDLNKITFVIYLMVFFVINFLITEDIKALEYPYDATGLIFVGFIINVLVSLIFCIGLYFINTTNFIKEN